MQVRVVKGTFMAHFRSPEEDNRCHMAFDHAASDRYNVNKRFNMAFDHAACLCKQMIDMESISIYFKNQSNELNFVVDYMIDSSLLSAFKPM